MSEDSMLMRSLSFKSSETYAAYLSHLSRYLPRVCEFLDTFSSSRKRQLPNYAQSQTSQKSGVSNVTSGISSLHPSTKRTTRKRRKS
jgi:hypothetical protein